MKKKIFIPILVAALVFASFIGYRTYLANNRSAEVISVANLNIGYWGDESSAYGMVYEAGDQSIYLDSTAVVTQVFVYEGQEVKAGDPLLAYDITSLELSVEMKELSVQQSQIQLQEAQRELDVLKNTKPIVVIQPTPTPIPTEKPKIIPVPEKYEDAYDYIVKMEQGEITETEIQKEPEDSDAEPTDDTKDESDSSHDPEVSAEPTDMPTEESERTAAPTSMPTEDPQTSSEPTSMPTEGPEPSAEPTQKPELVKSIHFVITNDGMILGKVLNELRDSEYETIYVEVYLENKKDPKNLLFQWMMKPEALQFYDDESLYSIVGIYHQELESESENIEPDVDVWQEGYTATELADMIQDKRDEIRNLDLEVRQKQLDLQIAKDSLSDGVVYAKRDGHVSKVSDMANPPQDGSAFLTVSTANGTYIETQISELQLNNFDPDTYLIVSSWESGSSYMAKVVSIDEYPSSSNYSYSNNPNVSFYNMYAVIEEDTDFTRGSWLQVSYTETTSTSAIWLSNSYIREDSGTFYVMKDVDGKLVRQNVKVGASMWGEYREIKEGLTEDDYIAFPYGKNSVEGTKTVISDGYGW